MPDANLTGLTPETSDALNGLMAQARAHGIALNVNSGFRTYEDQRQLYANWLAGKAGQPLPYPDRGSVALAARPGYSPHEFGVAFDVSPTDPSRLGEVNSIGRSLGLATVAGDPGHFQLASWKGGQMASDVPANQSAQPSRVGTPTPIPGGNEHVAFILDYARRAGVDPNLALGIANAEGLRAWSAANPNAASTVDVQNGQPFSFGDFQLNIHPGAVGAAAKAAGIDVTDPKQWQAADKFAIDYMAQHGVGAWSGDPVAKAYLASGKVPALAATPGTTGTATPGVGSGIAALTQATEPLEKTLGGGQQGGGMGGGGAGATAAPANEGLQLQQAAAMGPGAMRQQQIYQQAQQMMAALQQRAAQPLTGVQPRPQGMVYMGGQAIPMPGAVPTPGTTLNSMGG